MRSLRQGLKIFINISTIILVKLWIETLAKTIEGFSQYISHIKPDLIVVHGDRVEALGWGYSRKFKQYFSSSY